MKFAWQNNLPQNYDIYLKMSIFAIPFPYKTGHALY